MKSLLLLRHARTVRHAASLRDIDRPLEAGGHDEASNIGQRLKERGPLPDLVLASPALRARETVAAFSATAGLSSQLRIEDSIYSATCGELMRLVTTLPDDSQAVLMVGHNPGFEELLGRLTGNYQ